MADRAEIIRARESGQTDARAEVARDDEETDVGYRARLARLVAGHGNTGDGCAGSDADARALSGSARRDYLAARYATAEKLAREALAKLTTK